MKLDLTEILSRVGMRYAYPVSEPPLVDEDLECSAPVEGEIVFTNTGNALLVAGGVNTRVVLECGRCLRYYEEPVVVEIEEQFGLETRSAGPRGRHTETVVADDDGSDTAHLFDGAMFDLTELLRQGVTVALPMQPLHDEDCAGLCPSCGHDLNEGACACDRSGEHPAVRGALADQLEDIQPQ